MGQVFVEWDELVPVGKEFGKGRGTQRYRRETRRRGPFRSWQQAKTWRREHGVARMRLVIEHAA